MRAGRLAGRPGVRGGHAQGAARTGGGPARAGAVERRARLDRGVRDARRLPARAARRARGSRLGGVLPDPEPERHPRGDRVLHLGAARSRPRDARDDGQPGQPDRAAGGAAARGGAGARGKRAPARDRGGGARLHRHDRRPGPGARVQPRRRADLRLPGRRGDRPRDGRVDRAALPARAPPRRPGRLHQDRPRQLLGRRIEITGDARRRQRVPGGADDHAREAARAAALHGLRARHHRAHGARRRSCAHRAGASSRRATTHGGGSSATSTTAPSSGW